MDSAKIFWSGRSQAVRLPKNFRFEEHEVRIRRHGKAVILEPPARNLARSNCPFLILEVILAALEQAAIQTDLPILMAAWCCGWTGGCSGPPLDT